MKTGFGALATNLPLAFAKTLSGSKPAWQLHAIALYVRAIVQMHFARVFSLSTKLQLHALLVVILKLLPMNIGSLNGHSTSFGAAPATGMTRSRSMPSSNKFV
jgi:hypothetical protein